MRFIFVQKKHTEMAIYDQQNRKQQNHHHHHRSQHHHQQQKQQSKQNHRKLYNDQINTQCLKLREIFFDDHCSENIKEQIMKSKSILKKRRKVLQFNGAIQSLQYCMFIVFCFLLPRLIECQYSPHQDPRYYNREGDYSYHWPNPGDPEYR